MTRSYSAANEVRECVGEWSGGAVVSVSGYKHHDLTEVCMFSPCLQRFPQGSPVSSARSKLLIAVNISANCSSLYYSFNKMVTYPGCTPPFIQIQPGLAPAWRMSSIDKGWMGERSGRRHHTLPINSHPSLSLLEMSFPHAPPSFLHPTLQQLLNKSL